MAKKEKAGVDKLVKKVNKEFDKTSNQIEKLINDAFKQFDALQNQVQEPIKKLLDEIEKLREREMKRFNDELDRRLQDFHDLQHHLLERVGLASKEVEKSATKAIESASEKVEQATPAKAKTAKKASNGSGKTAKSASKKAPAKSSAKPSSKAPAKSSAKAPAAKKAAKPAAKKPAAAKTNAVSQTDLTKVKGIGPATAKKMQAMGITTIRQIAEPSADEKEKMKQFSSMRGYDSWSAEAKKLLA
ncbi:helix-hairpin-helix domain-containing protein [Marinobacter sp. JSM 1782161]|uniref:helix-hairpin-helix domain-containing protein n=1 Tax=Marinobacter sp. JSM 1782161 TaxID=2685906 RepID=UPI00140403B0|nr:helix-hairpin-helix domain-containing protein [Marinobacter sp. JSM 1782161]